MRAWPLAVLLAILAAGPSEAQTTGRATVLASDTFALGGQVFRLHGIDAVEFHQFCFVDGEPWACGAAATRALQVILDPVLVTCDPIGEETPTGAFATCTSEEGDIAQIMVRQGWALAVAEQSDAYVDTEAEAREAGVGIWRGPFVEPWEYRADVAAIEEEVVARTISEFRAELTQSLLGDARYVPGFADALITADASAPVERSVAAPALQAGFLGDAIPERGVFNWIEPAEVLAGWRRTVVTRVQTGASEAIGEGFSAIAGEPIGTEDEAAFYDTLVAQIEAFREVDLQPVLVVTDRVNPEWIGPWFDGAPPDGAVVTTPEVGEAAQPSSHIGTIDGIEVHRAAIVAGVAYLAPAGILEGVAFAPMGEDSIVTLEVVDGGEQLEVTFGIEVLWGEGPIIAIEYPVAPPENPYGS